VPRKEQNGLKVHIMPAAVLFRLLAKGFHVHRLLLPGQEKTGIMDLFL
jgi:hypothetical protein